MTEAVAGMFAQSRKDSDSFPANARPKMLIIGGAFSGATRSLVMSFQKHGFDVNEIRPSLRPLGWLRPFYILAMCVEASIGYGWRFRRYLHRTNAANKAYARSSEIVVSSQKHLNVVILIGVNFAPYWKTRRSEVTYVAFTDHTNLLSKKNPAFDPNAIERMVKPAWNRIERINLLLLDHIFVMGAYVKRSMVEDYQIPAARVSVVGAGPNADVDIERDKIEKDYLSKNILFVGLDATRKGLPALKVAFRRVVEVHADARLHVVGVTGANEPNITYYGKVEGAALRDLFYSAQIFAMPSLREPFGIVFLEAMWSKSVCVGTNIGAIPEIIDNEVTGYIVEPNDADAIYLKIVHLLDNPSVLKVYAANGYAIARRHWSWDAVVNRMLSQIQGLNLS